MADSSVIKRFSRAGLGKRVKSKKGGNTFQEDKAAVNKFLKSKGINVNDKNIEVSVGSKGSITVTDKKKRTENFMSSGNKLGGLKKRRKRK